jgi:MEMO1 family protein
MFFQASGNAQEYVAPQQRKPAFSGTFYPSEKAALRSRLQELFREAGQAVPLEVSGDKNGKVQTIVVPHAGFDYSGLVTAAGYLEIPKNAVYKNIFIITTTHRRPFEGVSTDLSSSYLTPLGELKINQQITKNLLSQHEQIIYYGPAHEREQGIEVHLPFIRYHFDQMPSVVPLVMGTSSMASARDLASALLPWFTPENLFIISADFSRYPSYSDATEIDQITADAVMSGNPEQFYNSLRSISNKAVKNLSTPSGDWSSIMTLLYMANQGENLEFKPLLYRNSGDSPVGDRKRVVGYWAIEGHQKHQTNTSFALCREDKTVLLGISRSTLESFIQNESIPEISTKELSSALRKPASVLVSLYMGERLRGRLEYISPAIPLYAMVQEMTIAAATLDKRFAPVESTELEYINIEISILSPLRKIDSIQEIDTEKHGIYLVKDNQYGTYLPGRASKENWSTEELLGHCAREKAGLGWDEWKEAELYIYEASTFSETELNPSSSPAL